MTGPWVLAILLVAMVGTPVSAHYLRRSVSRFRAGPVEATLYETVRATHQQIEQTREKVQEVAVAVEQVNKQINHVEDPDAELTVREFVKAIHQQGIETRADVADNIRAIARLERRLSSVEKTVGRLVPTDDTDGET